MAHSQSLEQWRDVKPRVDLRDVLGPQLAKFKPGNPAQALCPFHKDKTPSLSVYPDNYRCFACDAGGDLVDWYQSQPGGGLPMHEAVQAALKVAGVQSPSPATRGTLPARVEAKDALDVHALVSEAHTALMHGDDPLTLKAREYLEQRGLLQLADKMFLGVVNGAVAEKLDERNRRKYHGRLIIPYWQGRRFVYLKARALMGQEPKYQQPAGSIPGPWNVGAIEKAQASTNRYIILTEGEIDALSILAALGDDAHVIGLPGGTLADHWAEKLAGLTVYVLMDADQAGRDKAARLLEKLSGMGIEARAVRWQADDVNAYLMANGPDALADELIERLEEAAKLAVSDLDYVTGSFLEEIEARANRKHTAFPTGLTAFDSILGGGFVEGFHVIGGVPGGGKTSLCLQLAMLNAEAGRPVLYVTYEQPKFELWARIKSRLTGVPVMAFKTGRFFHSGGEVSTAEYLRLNHRADLEYAHKLAGFLRIVEGNADAGRWTVSSIKAEAARLKDAYGMPPLVVVDYLQRMPSDKDHERRELRERVGLIATALQVELSRGLGCPVVALSSLGRAAYGIKGNEQAETMMGVFKEAGEIEFTAYTATILYRLDDAETGKHNLYPTPKEAREGGFTALGLWVVKNREGEIGKGLAKFHPKRGLMLDAGRG